MDMEERELLIKVIENYNNLDNGDKCYMIGYLDGVIEREKMKKSINVKRK